MPTSEPLAGSDVSRVEVLREHLAAHNGIVGLEVLEPGEIERAVRLFHRDGFVVVRDALDADQVELLRVGVAEVVGDIVGLNPSRSGNRGSHRYSFGGSSITRSMLHRPEWQMLIDLPTVTPILEAIFGSADYVVRAASGDFCLPGAVEYQPLHADMRDFVDSASTPYSSFRDPRGHLSIRDMPCPYVCVNFMPIDMTQLNGPTRQIPGTQHSRAPIPRLPRNPSGCGSVRCVRPRRARCRSVMCGHGMEARRTSRTRFEQSPTSSTTRRGSGSRWCRASAAPIICGFPSALSDSRDTSWPTRQTYLKRATR